MKLKDEFEKLKEKDIYSLLLFALYKVKDLPELAPLPELAYVLDKENFLKLCEYFGGLTITIPTIKEVEVLIYTLVLYQYTNIEGKTFEEAIDLLGDLPCDIRGLRSRYAELREVLDSYSFSTRSSDE